MATDCLLGDCETADKATWDLKAVIVNECTLNAR